MDLVQATDQKYLVYESRIDSGTEDEERSFLHSDNRIWFWTDQFILVESKHDDTVFNFRVHNLLMNNSDSICFDKFHADSRLDKIFALNKNTGFIVESLGALHNIISLVEINWALGELQVIEQFERNCETVSIVVQESKPLKFILGCNDDMEGLNTYQICKFEQGTIKFGEVHQLCVSFGHFFDNKIFQHVTDDENDDEEEDEHQVSFKTYDLITKKVETFIVGDLPDEIFHGHFDIGDWICDRFYSLVCLNSDNIGIAWTDSRMHTLTAIDFETNLSIDKLQFFNGHLLTVTKGLDDAENDVVKIHLIPMRRPQLLRKAAWLNIIAKLKRDNVANPYNEAIKYLPFNADIRSPWTEDTGSNEKKKNTEQGDGDNLSGPDEQQNMEQESAEEIPPKRFKVDKSDQ